LFFELRVFSQIRCDNVTKRYVRNVIFNVV